MKSIFVLVLAMLFAIPSFARLTVSPSYVQFGTVKVGGFSRGSRSVYIQNRSQQAVNVNVGGYCADFRVQSMCLSKLYSNSSCTVNIEYRPARVGYHNCSLTVRDSEGDYQTISINGNAVQ